MVYTEIKERNGRKYFYRVLAVREGKRVNKKREYLGVNLSSEILNTKEKEADEKLSLIKKEKNKKVFEKIKKLIIKILKKHNIKKASIFGSYARGEQKKNSDIDIIIEPPKKMGLEFVEVAYELEDNLNRKVDLLTYNSIHPLIKKYVKKDEVVIL